MKRRKILGIVVLLCVVIACVSLLFLPIDREVYVLLDHYSTYEGRSGKYLKMSGNVYVNAEDFPDLPELQPGDVLEITHYRSHILHGLRGGTYFDDIVNIKKLHSADWGVSLTPAQVSATGIELSIGVDSNISRELKISAYSLDLAVDNQWQPLSPLSQPTEFPPIPFTDGSSVALDWESLYGTLAPGVYRLCATVSSKEESRNFLVAFTVSAPLPSNLDAAIEATVYDLLCKQLIYPKKLSNPVIEYIPRNGFVTDPPPALGTGRLFDQIAIDYTIVERTQSDNLYTINILGMCRGYLQKRFIDECYTPMRLVLQENADGTFKATSCIIPRKLHLTADSEQFFSYNMLNHLIDNQLIRNLQQACDAQMEKGGITSTAIVFQHSFEKNSLEAALIQEAIAAGKPRGHTDYGGTVYTLLIGSKTYYYYPEMKMIHDTSKNAYIVFSKSYNNNIKELLITPNQ